jgi:hypothetical protein
MKINGRDIKATGIRSLVLPADDGEEPIVLYAQPIVSFDEFHKLCEEPKPGQRYTPHGVEEDRQAPAYLEAMTHYRAQRWGYILLKSLEPSNIEWEKVNPHDSITWPNVEKEIYATFGHYAGVRVIELVEQANCLDAAKLEEARKAFFQKQAAKVCDPITPSSAAGSTQSGEPASDSESCPLK